MATTYVKDGEETSDLPKTGGYDVLKDGKAVASVPDASSPAVTKDDAPTDYVGKALDVASAIMHPINTVSRSPELKEAVKQAFSQVTGGTLIGRIAAGFADKDSTTASQTPSELKPKDTEPSTAKAQPTTAGPAPVQTIPQPKVKSSGSATPAIKEPSYETFTPAEIKDSDPNAGEDTLGKSKDEATKRLADATQALKDSQTVSPGQKLAMALIGLLPALGGGLIGAAIHNPTSAAAGISGGLEGSAKGLDSLNQDQKARIATAQKGVDTEKGNLLAAGKDLLERQLHNKDYGRGVGEKNTEEQNKAGEEGSKDRNATKMHTYLEQLTNAKDIQVGRERNAMELAKEHGAKSERADASQRIERSAADNITRGLTSYEKLRADVEKNNNYAGFMGDPTHASILDQELPNVSLGVHQSQQMNARSVPGPEVRALQEARFPAGVWTRKERTLAALDNGRDDMLDAGRAVISNSPNPPPALVELVNRLSKGGKASQADSPGQAAPDLTKHLGF